MFILLILTEFSNMLAQPKGFTDDPYVDDEKFIEKGNIFCLIFKKFLANCFKVNLIKKLKVKVDVQIFSWKFSSFKVLSF